MCISWIPLHACTLNFDMSSSVRDSSRKVNTLLADFSFVDSNTLSVLVYSYCILNMEVNCLNYMIKIV